MKKKTLVLLIIGVVVIAGAGIAVRFATRKGAEKIAENIIEKSTNGQVDVDYGSNTVTINTNSGSYSAGENVSLPNGFPSDIYVIEGDLKAAVSSGDDGYNLTIETSKTPAEASAIYDRELRADGWTISGTANYSGVYSIAAQKGNRYLSAGFTTSEGKNAAVITVYRQTDIPTPPTQ
ncbi:MAG: hypothetical protein WC734_00515 [Patescibacteria group bacterium]|jgi:hypothetical protein